VVVGNFGFSMPNNKTAFVRLNLTLRRGFVTVLPWKSVEYYAEGVSAALAIQHTVRRRRIILASLACRAVRCVSTLSHKRHDFLNKVIKTENACFDFLYNLCPKNF
jgi:hypothetical protein